MTFQESAARFDSYVDAFRRADGSLSDAMQCKYDHTFDVVRYAHIIAEGAEFPEEDLFLAGICALFHDIARFEQVKQFNTFNDHISRFDHGYEAVRILLEHNLLKEFSPAQRITVLAAIEFHNKIEIPSGICGEHSLKFARLTRDADKLAILDLVVRFLNGEIKVEDDSLIALSQAAGTDVNPEILQRIRAGQRCAYGLIRNMNDFLTCLFSWICDLNYPASFRELLDRKFYPKVRAFLPEDPVFDEILNLTNNQLTCACSK